LAALFKTPNWHGKGMNVESPLLVAIDIGTSSVRTHLMDGEGVILRTAAHPVQVALSPDGRAEVDPQQIWLNVCILLREILEGVSPKKIEAVGLASALGYIFVDMEGAPLGPAMLWMDRRAGREAQEISDRINPQRLYQITGRGLDPEIFLAKLLWFCRHEPQKYSKTRTFIGIKDYIISRLTGVIGSDLTHAAYTMLFDVNKRDWSDEILEVFKIPKAILPEFRKANEVAGKVTSEASLATGIPTGVPVVTGASDGTVGSLAAGVSESGAAVNVTGTSDVLMTTTPQPLHDPRQRTLLNPHPVLDLWMVGGIMGTTGGVLKWFTEKFCPDLSGPDRYRLIDTEAERAGIGARGLIALTGFSGERAPLWNPQARGVFFGLALGHGRGEVARAVLEGVAFTLRSMVEVLKTIGADVRCIRVVGGGAASDLWNQIRADVTQIPFERAKVTEGTATGIALLTGLGIGLYKDLGEATHRIAPVEKTYEPNPANGLVYEKLGQVQRRVYEDLCQSFKDLEEVRGTLPSVS
jgi:xylulokinase